MHWANAGAEPNGGAAEEDLRAFQEENKVLIAADLRSYLLDINGMRQHWRHDQDGNGFSFWPLSRFRPVEVTSFRSRRAEGDGPQFFVFADYLSSSWEYAIGLWGIERVGNPVLIIDNESRLVAGSFTEFVDLCLIDSPKLYPHPTDDL